jgi:hypothetical protein
MEVVIATLTVPDLAEATRPGASHPILGPLLAGGSYCTVEADAAEILAAARAVAGLSFVDAEDPRSASERAALCLIVADGSARSRPLATLHGRSLPALGAIPRCTVQDLVCTWTALLGGEPQGGRHLLHEQPEAAWDPRIERQLTQRLRQLYGE